MGSPGSGRADAATLEDVRDWFREYYGAANTVLGRGEIYFDSLTALVFLLLVGRWIGRRTLYTQRTPES